jgi:hypothetical protein
MTIQRMPQRPVPSVGNWNLLAVRRHHANIFNH